ncbi:MAG: hypothetical protein HQ517_00415, partial [SAR324 cluster bacterium]|nr:hypothetical protein [SAR324 cluster bacterium]
MVKNRQRSLLLALLLILSSGFVNSTLAEVAELKSSPESAAESEKNVDNGDSEKGLEKVEDGDGFDTVTVDMTVIESPPDEEKPFQFSGFTKEELAYSHAWEDPDFSKIRTTVNLTLDLKLPATWQAKINWNGFYDYAYSWAGRDKFTAETLKSAESESEMRDLYLDGYPVPWLNLRIGRQIIAWGQSESMQVTDMANPRDMRELGLVDIEDARLPVVATKLSLLLSSWQINFVAIHEIRANKMAGAGSEFDALSVMRSAFIIEDEEVPDSEISNTEYLIRVFKTFNGGDMGLVLADVYDDAFYLELTRIQLTGSQPQLS